ncbi:acyclic terpene utilization AtuA family protein [Ensifer sp. YR511]|uniref:acyclic terpene utilization AtuA family protein n=1 Tax=Ensifer sp. YR511 TaxID=1855294 RepID=UPI00088841DB|nr:acyclic terpene utilization AtuA family protein [Ensifer sp. YR511]SDN73376.1 Protein of unknown function [Ensifer sp. YR511]
MNEVRILAATGMLGAGFSEKSFERGLSLLPHVIACDGGSTDGGPTSLGEGSGTHPSKSLKRDLRIMLRGRDRLKIPMIVGSCGTAGGDAGVERVKSIVLEIAREEGLSFKLAVIRSEQDVPYLIQRFREGRILPLANAPQIDEQVFDRSTHIVGMMGPEPIQAALESGADVVLAGRSSDTSLYSAYPLLQGISPGPVWHAAKTIECGASASVNRKRPDSMFAWIRQDHFEVEPLDLENYVTPQSIASHTLYENADPHLVTEPSGIIDSSAARYEQASERSVRVYGSTFRHSEQYTIKLEGAELVGYQHVIIGGVRDPYILRQLDSWLANMKTKMQERVQEIFGGSVGPSDYSIHHRIYGRDGTMGKLEPNPETPAEVGLVFTVTANEEAVSATIAKSFAHLAVHYPIPEWGGLITGIAYPYSPAEINRGAAYRFNLNHVVIPDDPYEMFPISYLEVTNG